MSPCGVICPACSYYPADCAGCAAIQGRVFWLAYTGGTVCDIYRCCTERGHPHCGRCAQLPCGHFTDSSDPTKTPEENEADLKKQMSVLRAAGRTETV